MKPAALPSCATLAAAVLGIALFAGSADCGVASTSTTTTTTDPGPTTTTTFIPVDVTEGGRFEGGFPRRSFDVYSFDLDVPRVLVAQTSKEGTARNCPGDTVMRLTLAGVGGGCGSDYASVPCEGDFGDDKPCIACDDDSGPYLCSRLVHRVLAPGSYWIRVSAYGGAAIPSYDLDVSFVDFECGNGVVELTEQCDDGNTASGDCCSSACLREPAGQPCDDGVFCNGADTCGPAGACSVHAGNPCPGPDGDGNCSESCDESSDSCTAADPTFSPCDDGLFCNGTDTCFLGECVVHSGNPCPGVDGDGNCSESCDEAANNCAGADPNGSPCQDGLFCNGTDSCFLGACSVHSGNPCPGVDGDGNCAESCNEAADDCAASDPDGAPCDDGIFCNGADTCLAGVCSVHAGNPCPGLDGDGDCAETCDEIGDNCAGADPDGSPCDDGIFCNGADSCIGGLCNVHAGDPCSGPDGDVDCAETCDEAAGNCLGYDPDGSACNDGLFCNGTDHCIAGACAGHTGDLCTGVDGDADCMESCSDTGPGCMNPDPDGTPCDDGIVCNGPDRCQGGTCSVHLGSPCPGPDGDGNCAESCAEGSATCDNPDPAGSACDDGNPCTTATCDGAGNCVSGPVLSCDDGNPCTVDSCDGKGGCLHGPPLSCDDGDPCTVDSCVAGGTACSNAEIPDCEPPPLLCGDVNGDGAVRASDALSALRAAVGGNDCAARPCICDANGSGTINTSDALLILRVAVGSNLTTSCPC